MKVKINRLTAILFIVSPFLITTISAFTNNDVTTLKIMLVVWGLSFSVCNYFDVYYILNKNKDAN